MPNTKQVIRQVKRAPGPDFDEQVWPINVVLGIFAGCVAGIILAVGDFETPNLLQNGWVQLAALALVITGLVIATAQISQRYIVRRLQLAATLSLLLHLIALIWFNFMYLKGFVAEDDETSDWRDETRQIALPDYGREPTNDVTEEELFKPSESQAETLEEAEQQPASRQTQADQPQTAAAAGSGEPSQQQSATPANLTERRVQTAAPRSSDRLSGIQISRRADTGQAEPSEITPTQQPTPRDQPSPTTVESNVASERAAESGRANQSAPMPETSAPAASMASREDTRRPVEEPSPQPGESAPAPSPTRQTAAAAPAATVEVEAPTTAAAAPSQPSTDAAATATRVAQASAAPAASPSQTPQSAPAATSQAASTRRAQADAPAPGQPTAQPQRSEQVAQAPSTPIETPRVAAASQATERAVESATEASPRQSQPDAEAVPVAAANAADAAPAAAEVAVMQPRRADTAAEPSPQAPAARTTPAARSAESALAEAEEVPGPSIAAAAGRADPSADPQPAPASPTRRAGSAPAVASNESAASDDSASASVATQPLRDRSSASSSSDAPAAASQTAQVTRQATGSNSNSTQVAAESTAVASASGGGPRQNIEASATANAGRSASTATPSASAGTASNSPAVAAVTPTGGRTRLGSAAAAGQSANEAAVRASSPTRSATGGQAIAATPVANPTAATPSPGQGGPAEPQPNAQATASARGGAESLPVTAEGLAQPLPDSRPGSANSQVAANTRRTTGAANPDEAPSTASGGQIARANRDATAAMPDDGPGLVAELAAGGASGEPGVEPAPAPGSGQRVASSTSALAGAASVEAELGAVNRQPALGGRQGKSNAADADQPDASPNTASRVARSAAGSAPSSDTAPGAATVEVAAGGGPARPTVDASGNSGGRVRGTSGTTGASAEDPSAAGTAAGGALAVAGRRGGERASTDPQTGSPNGGQLPSRTAGAASLAGGALAEVGMAVAGSPAAPGSPDATATASSARSQSSGSVSAAGATAATPQPGTSGVPVAAGRGASRRGDDQLAAAGGASTQAPGRADGGAASTSAIVPGVGTELASAAANTGASPVEAAETGNGRPRSQSDGQLVLGGTGGQAPAGPGRATTGIAGGSRKAEPAESGPTLDGAGGGGAALARADQGAVGGIEVTADAIGPMAAAAEVAVNDEQGPAGGASSRPAASVSVEVAAADGPGGLSNSPAMQLGLPNRRARPQSDTVAISSKRFVLKRSAGQPSVDVQAATAPAFRQRMPSEREKTAQSRGGSAGTEEAVEMGLDFLARHQSPDGRWSLNGFAQGKTEKEYQNSGLGEMNSDTAATGLALLSFFGAGYTHRDGKYRDVVNAGLAFLIEHQKADGDLFTGVGGSNYCWLYSHGIASIALCEAYGMTQDPAVREPAQKCLDFIAAAQEPGVGGWRYVPQVGSDTSVSGWQMMALKSGELAGLEVQSSCYPGVTKWLDTAQGASGVPSRYAYRPGAQFKDQREPSTVMTAEALLMRLYLGWQRNNPHLMAGADYLLENLPNVGTKEKSQRDAYYWYYATQVMFQVGGEHWKSWNDRLRPLLLEGQTKTGAMAGSWDPLGPVPDKWARKEGGRIYLTAMNLLMLEVYYRHLPLYQTLGEQELPPQ